MYVDAGLWDKTEVLQFSGIINKVVSTQVSSAQEPSAHNIDKGVKTYVMDNCCYPRRLMASWYDYFVYYGWIDPHSSGTRDYCSCGKPD
jgi:hypothetical protein